MSKQLQRVGGLTPHTNLDPATSDWLQSAAENTAGLTPGQKRKRQNDRRRNKSTFDLPESLTFELDAMAGRLDVPPSDLVAAFLRQGMLTLPEEQLSGMRTQGNLLRYRFRLLPDLSNPLVSQNTPA